MRCAVLEESFRGDFPVCRVSDEKMDILSEDVWADPDAEYEIPGRVQDGFSDDGVFYRVFPDL